ncbi:MAG: hypothetical protein ACOYM3_28140 [Terrimicrobiaceae bacterium]
MKNVIRSKKHLVEGIRPGLTPSISSRKHFLWVLGAQSAALAVAAWFFRHGLNPDAVAYLRIASYYTEGNAHLAVSGYWSPLISWMLVPFLKLDTSPLIAGRIVMGLSAIIFLLGCRRLFQQFEIPTRFLSAGLWLCALVSIPWSVENITPDLLLAGLVCFAFANIATPRWFLNIWLALSTGMLWGLAFLCKAVALPLGILTSVGIAALWWKRMPPLRPKIAVATGILLLGLGLISSPWISVISLCSGKLIVTTSAAYNHSLVGPSVVKPVYLLDHGFSKPEPGRVTIWENPSSAHPDWSPFTNWRNVQHQLLVIFYNLPIVVVMLTGVSLIFPVLILFAAWRSLPVRYSSDRVTGGSWALLPVGALAILYLPNHLLIYEQRYFYAAFPLLFVATVATLNRNCIFRHRYSRIRRRVLFLVVICFLLPTIFRSVIHLGSSRMAGERAYRLAQMISMAGLDGPIAGSGKLPGGRAGLYTAYFLDQPWYGDILSPGPLDFRQSGASLIVIRRGVKTASELDSNHGFLNLDSRLFDTIDTARQFPLQVFKVLPRGEPSQKPTLP